MSPREMVGREYPAALCLVLDRWVQVTPELGWRFWQQGDVGSININSCSHSLKEVALRGQDWRFNVLKSESGCKGTLTLLPNPEKEGHGEAPGEHRGRSMKRLSGKGMELSESLSAVRAGAELRAVGREQFHGESRKVWRRAVNFGVSQC